MDQEVAKLCLFGANISATQSAIGIRGSDARSYSFIFDLRRVLGETLYEKYDAFKVFIVNDNTSSNATGLATMFTNGLNLIQASYQGKQNGFETAISGYNSFVSANDPLNIPLKTTNTREFVMIKPNDTQVQLNISLINDNGLATVMNIQLFFLTFVPFEKNKISQVMKNPFNYLYQNELANFTLTTQILSAGATNSFGTMNSTYSQFTFTNVNLRNIVGTLWDKFDKFNLVCLNVGIGQTATVLNGAQRNLFFQIQGLQFINCISTGTSSSYLQGTGYTPIFRYAAVSTAEGDCFDVPSSLLSFRKPESENVDLAFQLFTGNGGGAALNAQMNQFSLTFAVVGIKE